MQIYDITRRAAFPNPAEKTQNHRKIHHSRGRGDYQSPANISRFFTPQWRQSVARENTTNRNSTERIYAFPTLFFSISF
ncbi:MAG: hypothetical protein IJ050_06300, partial [Clostridia bacterium]|nr:hypothetical protein [Clostridia bacterium]